MDKKTKEASARGRLLAPVNEMPAVRFPDPRSANDDGIVAVGGDLELETLLAAYRAGIFPWPVAGLPLLWFSPERRAVLDFDDLHIGRSLRRACRRHGFSFSIDRQFARVIHGCARTPRPGQDGTWITAAMQAAYVRLHRHGWAHCVEVWDGDALVGGVYGVAVDGVFSGESMFHRRSDASKLALLHLVGHLRLRGLRWLDVQIMTPHLQRLGAREIDRDEFLARLGDARDQQLRPFP